MSRAWTTAVARLALAAMLALALLPTLGRVAQPHRAGIDRLHDTRCVDDRRAGVPAPHRDRMADGDCAYCPLVAGMAPAPLPPGNVARVAGPDAIGVDRVRGSVARGVGTGLGARGPPALG